MRRPTAARSSALVLGVALALATPSSASLDSALRAARAAVSLPRSSEGMQARYDAGRALANTLYARRTGCSAQLSLATGLVAWAEAYDRLSPGQESAGRRRAQAALRRLSQPCTSSRLAPRRSPLNGLPALVRAAPARGTDRVLDDRIEALGRSFPGFAAIWVHDLVSGRTAGWNTDARFPAASTVKLGVLLAAFRQLPHPERSPLDYDFRAMTQWSSNLAANLLVERFGVAAVEAALRRAGAYRSTFPQGYRVGTARADVQDQPPFVSGRVTTAHDLGRLLYALHGCALGSGPALRATGLDRSRCRYAVRLLLSSDPRGNNAGLVRPFVPSRTPVAQKNGWLHDARHSAAIVYLPRGPKIVVVLTYAPDLALSTARTLGRRVVAAVF